MASKAKYMKDAQGNMIPVKNIAPIDIERDKMVNMIIPKAKRLSGDLKKFKHDTHVALKKFIEAAAKNYGAPVGGRKKGNLSLTSFDGQFMVKYAVSDRITFNEGLQIAKTLIDECLSDWTKRADENIRILIMNAFDVDKEGKLNKEKILSLKKYKINDRRWQKAMVAIDESIQIVDSAWYIRVYEKNEMTGKYEILSLDMASA